MSNVKYFLAGLLLGAVLFNVYLVLLAYKQGARVCIGWEPYVATRCFEREREPIQLRNRTADGEPDEADTH